jgi:YesN/AraC family two-component response regulator
MNKTSDDKASLTRNFSRLVNMSPEALKKHLDSQESQKVGYRHEGEAESVGHQQGQKILKLLKQKNSDPSEDDMQIMRKVIGYIHRHLAQGGPEKDAEHSPWRYSLMNWGHDPLKKQ